MRIALLGSHGYIASQLKEVWENVVPMISFSRFPEQDEEFFDLLQLEKVNFTRFEEIDYTLFLAGNSSLEACENGPDAIRNINVLATQKAIHNIMKQGCKVLFFSSDAVFGEQSGAFYENSKRVPMSCYGKFKKAVEDDLFAYKDATVIRLSYVFCMKDKFTQYLMHCFQRGEQAEIYHPFSRTVISLMDLAELLLWVMHHWGKYRLINACGKDMLSRRDIADSVSSCLGINFDYRIERMPHDFARLRPAATNMRSLYLGNIMPQRYNEDFIEKVRREYARYQQRTGEIQCIKH